MSDGPLWAHRGREASYVEGACATRGARARARRPGLPVRALGPRTLDDAVYVATTELGRPRPQRMTHRAPVDVLLRPAMATRAGMQRPRVQRPFWWRACGGGMRDV